MFDLTGDAARFSQALEAVTDPTDTPDIRPTASVISVKALGATRRWPRASHADHRAAIRDDGFDEGALGAWMLKFEYLIGRRDETTNWLRVLDTAERSQVD